MSTADVSDRARQAGATARAARRACPAGPARRSSWRSASLAPVDHRDPDRPDPAHVGGTTQAAVRLLLPILFAALGGLWAERAGVINIGLEGMMILGTWGAAWAGYQWGPWAARRRRAGVRRARRAAARRRHGVVRRQPHRLRRRDHAARAWASRSTCRRWSSCRSRRTRGSRPRVEGFDDVLGHAAGRRARRARTRATRRALRRRRAARRPAVRADAARRCSGSSLVPASYLRAVAHRVRPAAALVRGEPGGRGVAGRARSTPTSTWRWSSPARSPGSAAPRWCSTPASSATWRARPAAAATSASPR